MGSKALHLGANAMRILSEAANNASTKCHRRQTLPMQLKPRFGRNLQMLAMSVATRTSPMLATFLFSRVAESRRQAAVQGVPSTNILGVKKTRSAFVATPSGHWVKKKPAARAIKSTSEITGIAFTIVLEPMKR